MTTQLPHVFGTLSGQLPASYLDDNYNTIIANIIAGAYNYALDIGTASAYVVTLNPAPTALADGMTVTFKALNNNVANPTLNVNGLGAYPIVGSRNQTGVQAGAIYGGAIYRAVWAASLMSFVLWDTNLVETGNAIEPYQAVNLGQFASSNTNSGYSKLPNGVIMEWGGASASTSGSNITWPIAFPTSCVAAVAVPAGLTSPISVSFNNITRLGATLYSGSQNPGCTYIAMGY